MQKPSGVVVFGTINSTEEEMVYFNFLKELFINENNADIKEIRTPYNDAPSRSNPGWIPHP